jgi:hypothetical protein
MLLNGKIDDELDDETGESSSDSPTRAWAIGVGICCLFPLYLLFSALGNAGRGTAAACFGGALIITVRLRWEMRKHVWFWVVIGFLVLVHLAIVLLIPWPNRNYTLPIVLPVGIVDILAISFFIQFVAKRFGLTAEDDKSSSEAS